MLISKKKRQIKKWTKMCSDFDLIMLSILSKKHSYYAYKELDKR